jgi:hypothetical protein
LLSPRLEILCGHTGLALIPRLDMFRIEIPLVQIFVQILETHIFSFNAPPLYQISNISPMFCYGKDGLQTAVEPAAAQEAE